MTADVFLVVTNTRTKSIQKQVKSINIDKVGSKKYLASTSVSFHVELIASSFLDLIFKQARLNAAVSGFLLFKDLHQFEVFKLPRTLLLSGSSFSYLYSVHNPVKLT